ncbi:MAG: Signal peptidase I, partial [Candidatus Moranbacteria bacterium GW2011_GWE1_36_7]
YYPQSKRVALFRGSFCIRNRNTFEGSFCIGQDFLLHLAWMRGMIAANKVKKQHVILSQLEKMTWFGFLQINMTNKNLNMQENNDDDVYYGVGSFLWEVLKVFLWALAIIVPIRVFLFQPFFVQGASMESNFKDGDYLIVNEFGYKKTSLDFAGKHFFTVNSFRELNRADVVVFRYPKDPKQFFIKRVIGLPGEKVKVESGVVTIYNAEHPDGFLLDEKAYLPAGLITNNPATVQLKADEYFVLGDNRQASHDSRVWGPLPEKDVIGKVLIRAWPLPKAEIL